MKEGGLVGDHGPELVELPPGTVVLRAGDTFVFNRAERPEVQVAAWRRENQRPSLTLRILRYFGWKLDPDSFRHERQRRGY
jgi:hypothetical protein